MKKILILVCIVAICYACKQKPTAEKLTTLACGESTKITEQELCDKLINTPDGNTITIGAKTYTLCKEPLIFAIKGSMIYTLEANNQKLKVTLTINEGNSLWCGWIEKTCD
ncbi:MAG: hypothetical protein WCG98_10495 [bacterium]